MSRESSPRFEIQHREFNDSKRWRVSRKAVREKREPFFDPRTSDVLFPAENIRHFRLSSIRRKSLSVRTVEIYINCEVERNVANRLRTTGINVSIDDLWRLTSVPDSNDPSPLMEARKRVPGVRPPTFFNLSRDNFYYEGVRGKGGSKYDTCFQRKFYINFRIWNYRRNYRVCVFKRLVLPRRRSRNCFEILCERRTENERLRLRNLIERVTIFM